MKHISKFSDLELCFLLKNDSKEAFECLYLRYLVPLTSYSRKIFKSKWLADEAIQEIFFRLWDRRHHLEVNSNFKAYMYSAVRNYFLNYLRSNRRFVFYEAVHFDSLVVENGEFLSEFDPILIKITAFLNQLPKNQRLALELSRINGLSNEEISRRMNISKRTVEHHLYLANKRIKRIYS